MPDSSRARATCRRASSTPDFDERLDAASETASVARPRLSMTVAGVEAALQPERYHRAEAVICRFASSCCGCDGRPTYRPFDLRLDFEPVGE